MAAFTIAVFLMAGCGGGQTDNNVLSTTPAAAPVATTTPAAVPAEPPADAQAAAKVPDAPTGVSAAGGTNKITLSWNAAGGATSYNVYWSPSSGVTAATGARVATSGNVYVHRGLPPAADYYYVVTALNGSGESAASAQAFTATAQLDGSAPYGANCASCHGSLANSSATNKSVDQIMSALQTVGSMCGIALTDSQIADISAALTYNE